MKQLLTLPTNCPDTAIYVLTGILPIEAQIDIKTLNFFNNICCQCEQSVEKRLGRRQLTVKSIDSYSWFIDIRKILIKYELNDAIFYLDNPSKKGME